jgi:hypothetical protein
MSVIPPFSRLRQAEEGSEFSLDNLTFCVKEKSKKRSLRCKTLEVLNLEIGFLAMLPKLAQNSWFQSSCLSFCSSYK